MMQAMLPSPQQSEPWDQVATAINLTAWATPAEGISLNELIIEMAENGTPVLEVDRLNNRLKVCDHTEEL